MAIFMLKIRRPLGRLIFNMGIAIPGKTVFLIETAPRVGIGLHNSLSLFRTHNYSSLFGSHNCSSLFGLHNCPSLFGLHNCSSLFGGKPLAGNDNALLSIEPLGTRLWKEFWIRIQREISFRDKAFELSSTTFRPSGAWPRTYFTKVL